MPHKKTKHGRRSKKRRVTHRTKRRSLRHSGGNPLKTVHENADSKIKVFMCASKTSPTLELLLRSLERHGYSYEVLGFGKPWNNLGDKLKYYEEGSRNHLETNGKEELLIMIDAYDIICIKDSQYVYNAWLNRPRKMPVLYSSEQNCMGNCFQGNLLKWFDVYQDVLPPPYNVGSERLKNESITIHYEWPDVNKPIKSKMNLFFNTGFIMGKASDIASLMKEILTVPYEIDDQYTTGIYLNNDHYDLYDIDIESTFSNTVLPFEPENLPDKNAPGQAAFIHFPGNRSEEAKAQLAEAFRTTYME